MSKLIKKTILIASIINVIFLSNTLSAHDFKILNYEFGINQVPGADAFVQTKSIESPGIFTDGVYAGEIPTGPSAAEAQSPYLIFGYLTDSTKVSAWTKQTGTRPGVDVGSNHPAPSFDLVNLTADLSSFYVYWNDIEFNQGSSNVTLTDNLNGTYLAEWSSLIVGGPFDGQTGNWKMLLNCTTCDIIDPAPSITLSASQGSQITRTITPTTNVTVTSPLGTPANHTFEWNTPDTITDNDGNTSDGSFTFNPNTLAPGLYTISTVYTDETNLPTSIEKGQGKITLRVVASAAGIDINDNNNNGIINENDANLSSNQLQLELNNGSTFIMTSDKGDMKIGQTAFCAAKAANINQSDMASFSGTDCTINTISNDDKSIKDVGIGGYFDFEIHGLSSGESVNIVIPLNTVIPESAIYRKFSATSESWSNFDKSGNDKIKSAQAISNGVCPEPGSGIYTNGLTPGHTCIQLSITDGGANDSDTVANGQIIDPGAIAEIRTNTKATLSSGCSISGKPSTLSNHSEWWLLLAALTWLGLSTHRKKH